MSDTQKMSVNEQVTSLINRAAQAEKADDALKFSQAACNTANAACAANTANQMVHLTSSD